jgi:hypothetical protein
MSMTPTRWAKQIDWDLVLRAAGADRGNAGLPATIRCPTCHNSLTIFDDPLLKVPWLHCPHCRFFGDAVEWYGHFHKLPQAQALWHIAELLLIRSGGPAINPAEVPHGRLLADRERVKQFWSMAISTGLRTRSAALYELLPALRVMSYLTIISQMPAGVRLIGKATRQEIDELFFPDSFKPRQRLNHNGRRTLRRGSGPGRRRILPGADWGNMIVMPFHDLPGRICGLLLIGRDADRTAGDMEFKAAAFNRRRDGVREAGLAFSQVLDGPITQHFPDVVFIFPEPLAALQFHVRWLHSSLQWLPLVAAYYDNNHATRSSFAQLGHVRQRIVYAPQPTDELFMAARYADAYVALPPEDRDPESYEGWPLQWLRILRRHALPWRDALRNELRRREPADAAQLLRKLNLSPRMLWEVIEHCGAEVQTKLAASGDESLLRPRTTSGGKMIVETHSGWLVEGSGLQICNASIRIEEELVTKDRERHYRGFVRLNDSTVPFVVPAPAVRKLGLFECLKQFLERSGAGELQYNRSWNRFAEQIALQLHEPKVFTQADVVGWHDARLVLPRFTITMGGHILRDQVVKFIDPETPARSIEPPAELTRAQLRPVTVITPTTARFWAIVTNFAHNITASLCLRNPVGLVLSGAGAADVADAIGGAFDCPQYRMPKSLSVERADKEFKRVSSRHDWPTVITPPLGRATGVLCDWLADPISRNFVISLNLYAAQVAASQGWRVLEIDEPTELATLLHDHGRDVLLAYLQDICRRRMSTAGHPAGSFSTILRDLANWCGLVGRGKQAVMEAREVMDVDEIRPAWEPLMALMRRFLADGELRIIEGRSDQVPQTVDKVVSCDTGVARPATVWIPWQQINKLLKKKNAPPLDYYKIHRSLSQADASVWVRPDGPDLYWIVKRRWWNQQVLQPIGSLLPSPVSEAS